MAKKKLVKRADVENHEHCIDCGWCARQGTVHICQQHVDAEVLEVMHLDMHPGSSRVWIEAELAKREFQAFRSLVDVGSIDNNDAAGRWLAEHDNNEIMPVRA